MKPTPEYQVQFLTNIQRLLTEGQFVATYKYALLLALADIAVEFGDDSGDPLLLPTNRIAEKFIEYYWRQGIPYIPRNSPGGVLRQNTGRQAEVLVHIREIRNTGSSLAGIKRDRRRWASLVSKVDAVVRNMPLWKLQTVGRTHLEFLYENRPDAKTIELKSGVAFCFRQFYGLTNELIRGAWVRFVRKQNPDLLGTTTDLMDFMFGCERSNLGLLIPILKELQNGRCFYCTLPMNKSLQVDHFVAWSRYQVDLGHNLVLADDTCNSAKADHMAAREHLLAWVERNARYASELVSEFDRNAILHDLPTTMHVTEWAYAQTEFARGLTWLRKNELIPLAEEWRADLRKLDFARMVI
jgi:5-methylcytosine-specific restriction endonuclease McrA